MENNVGTLDALIRGGLAIVFLALAAALNHRPFVSLVSAFVALVLAGTALTRWCPLYRQLGISTRGRRSAHDRR